MIENTKPKPEEIEYIEIGSVSEISDGERLFLEIDDKQFVLFEVNGELYAIDDLCSHDNGPLGEGELEEFKIVCPRHGARFDIRTGKAVSLPAVVDICAYPVRIQSGNIEIGFPKNLT